MRRDSGAGPPGEPQGSQERPRSAFDFACRYLTSRERCAAQVRDYLKRKGFEADEIERALEKLRERRLVDDLRFARLYVESRSRRSPRSRAFLIRELMQKGVDAETARLVVLEFLQEVPEEELARRLLARLPSNGPDARERAARRLRSRGFKGSTALGARGNEEEPEGED